jgi:hypothetical protein
VGGKWTYHYVSGDASIGAFLNRPAGHDPISNRQLGIQRRHLRAQGTCRTFLQLSTRRYSRRVNFLAEAIKSGRPEDPEAFVIADEEGRALAILPFTAVLPRPLKK